MKRVNPKVFGTLTPEEAARVLESGSSGGPEGWLVVLGRREKLPADETIADFAEGLLLDRYTARQWLKLAAPRILRKELEVGKARRWLSWLKALELPGFVLPASEFQDAEIKWVRSLTLSDKGLKFRMDSGSVDIHPPAILCFTQASLGQRQIREIDEEGLLGNVVANRREVRPDFSLPVLDICLKSSPGILRLTPEELDFQAIFPASAQEGSFPLFRKLIEELRERAPAAPLYEDFPAASASLRKERELLERRVETRVARLAPLGGLRRSRREKVWLEGELEAFDLYSVLNRKDALSCGEP